MARSDELARRLRAARGKRIRPRIKKFLSQSVNVTVTDDDFLSLDKTLRLRESFIARLRDLEGTVYPATDSDSLAARLKQVEKSNPRARAVWLHGDDGLTGAIEVPVAPLIKGALAHFVTPASDLMLASDDVRDGLCVEFNHLPAGDEYEFTAWGRFARDHA